MSSIFFCCFNGETEVEDREITTEQKSLLRSPNENEDEILHSKVTDEQLTQKLDQERIEAQQRKKEEERARKQQREEAALRQKKAEDKRKREEQERLKRENKESERIKREKEEHEHLESIRKEKEEKEQKQKEEQERIQKEKEEQERKQKEKVQQERIQKEKEEQERKQKEEQERIQKEKAEQERIQKEKEEQERKQKEEQERIQKEKEEQELIQKEKEEQERIQKEKEEQERIQKEKEEQERLQKEKEEQERIQKEEQEPIQREKEEVDDAGENDLINTGTSSLEEEITPRNEQQEPVSEPTETVHENTTDFKDQDKEQKIAELQKEVPSLHSNFFEKKQLIAWYDTEKDNVVSVLEKNENIDLGKCKLYFFTDLLLYISPKDNKPKMLYIKDNKDTKLAKVEVQSIEPDNEQYSDKVLLMITATYAITKLSGKGKKAKKTTINNTKSVIIVCENDDTRRELSNLINKQLNK